jgi:hydrogenase/urease accessory protein HupE
MMFAPFLFAAALVASHPNSFSSSVVRVDGARVTVELRAQARSLAEALPIDGDRDGTLAPDEVASGREEIARYLRDHFLVFADVAAESDVVLAVDDVTWKAADSGSEEAFVVAKFSGARGADFEALAVRTTLFVEANPLHRDTCTIVWNRGETASWLFPEAGDVFRFTPADQRRPGVFASYVELGVEHILTGYDHLAFLLALLLAAARLRSIVGVVSAFTVAHSVTLALATLEVVHVDSRYVEMAIALSIAYVACLDLLQKRPSARWLEAFCFGLIHGLGFASSVADALTVEPLKVTALVGFNLGVECGQLVAVGLAFGGLRMLSGDRSGVDGTSFVAPHAVRRPVCVVLILLGLYWFAERAGWTP